MAVKDVVFSARSKIFGAYSCGVNFVRRATMTEYLYVANGHTMDDRPSRSRYGMGGRTPLLKIVAMIAVILPSVLRGPVCASDWEVIAERDGIMVSRQPVEGRGFPKLRSVGVVAGTPYEVLAILLDVPAHVEWRPDCVESKTVRKVDTWRNIVYTRTDLPWPLSDREVVVENEVNFIEAPSKVKVTFREVTAPDLGRRPGTVRMKMATGFFLIEAIDGERSRVHYELNADPAGTLPAWLITTQSTRNPYVTMTGLRRRLEETRGQYSTQIAGFPP